jgi:hypothetical protein
MNPGKERESTKTAHSGTTRKGQSRQHIQQTGSSDRENTEENWGMAKRDLGELSRSKENTTSYLQQIPI